MMGSGVHGQKLVQIAAGSRWKLSGRARHNALIVDDGGGQRWTFVKIVDGHYMTMDVQRVE